MTLHQLKSAAALYYKNLRGWRTGRKIVVIESDDWGSIRMPSREVYEKCLGAGYRVDKIAYERYDSLASEADLLLLFDLLTGFSDQNGHNPVITANVLPANPDFDKIRESGYQEYYYELITSTFKRYPKHANCFKLWTDGLKSGVFFPQSHGREHLNVSMFMSALKKGDKDVLFGFEHQMPGNINSAKPEDGNRYVESLHYINKPDRAAKLEIVVEGLKLFEQLFGYKSFSFIPPNYKWSPDYNISLAEYGVKYFQGIRKMKEPLDNDQIKYHSHYLGEINNFNQTYLVRNAFFEPSLFNQNIVDPVSKCMNQIEIAFRMMKPAIICSHRLNYVGFIDESNRDRNLVMLKKLLSEIIKKWPDVEFVNSVELGNLINQN